VPAAGRKGPVFVDRGALDAALLEVAREAGVDVIQPARARVSQRGDGWWIEARGRDKTSVASRYVVDAAGRAGCIRGRRVRSAPVTVALWTTLEANVDGRAWIEAAPDGWSWAAPVGARAVSAMWFGDPSRVPRDGDRDLEAFLRAQWARTTLFRDAARAPFARPVMVLDATPGHAAQPIGSGFVKVGEASYSLDPLSSTGVEKVLQTAVAGALVAHTLLRDPSRAILCARFVRDRQREAVATHEALARAHYAAVERYAQETFWSARRAEASVSAAAASSDTPRRPPPPGAPIDLAPDASVVDEACIVDDAVDVRRALRSPALARPMAFFEGIEVAPLLDVLATRPTWEVLVARWGERLSSERAERLANWLWGKRVIREATADVVAPSLGA
jgi:flavin-dependent dehydrogenase